MARAGLKFIPIRTILLFIWWIQSNVSVMVEAFGYSMDDLKSFMLNGLEGSWLDSTTKSNLQAVV